MLRGHLEWLPEISAVPAPRTFTAFLSGRINADTRKIKQAHLGVAGFANAISFSNAESDALNSCNNPRLCLRGLSSEKIECKSDSDPENELRKFGEQHAGGVINLSALPFTTDREKIFDELRGASVALMPSWHEGFGLVAWEAIAAAVPLILSKKSGVYHFLKEFENGVVGLPICTHLQG